MLPESKLNKIRKTIAVDEDDKMSLVFGALGDPRRLKIFKMLSENHNICVSEIAKIFGVSVPAASQQLKVLEAAGLVKGERTGQSMCYQIKEDDPLVKLILRTIE